MARSLFTLFLLALAGCASVQNVPPPVPSPCDVSEVSYECRVDRYNHVNQP